MNGIESIQSLINGIYIYQKNPQSITISVPSFHRVRYWGCKRDMNAIKNSAKNAQLRAQTYISGLKISHEREFLLQECPLTHRCEFQGSELQKAA
jgi:hypothetical protein